MAIQQMASNKDWAVKRHLSYSQEGMLSIRINDSKKGETSIRIEYSDEAEGVRVVVSMEGEYIYDQYLSIADYKKTLPEKIAVVMAVKMQNSPSFQIISAH